MKKIYKIYVLLIIPMLLISSCIDSQSVEQDKVPYTMTINSPASGDSVMVGRNLINYTAEDNPLGGGFSQFEVFVNGVSQNVFLVGSDGASPKLYFDLDSTYLNKTISIFVTAYNKSYSYKTSEPITGLYVKENTSPPNAPDSLFVTKINTTAVLLVWVDNATNETGYEVWRSIGNNLNYSSSAYTVLPANTISFTDGNLNASTAYFYKVRAINKFGHSGFSNEVNSTGNQTGGDAPYEVKAEVLGATIVNLTWKFNSTSSVNAFEIQRIDPPGNGTWKSVGFVSPSTRDYTDAGLKGSSDYQYRVGAIFATKKVFSSAVSVTTAYQDIQGPTNLSVSYDNVKRVVNLTWNDNTNQEIGTYIERKDDANDYQVIHTTGPDATSFNDTIFVQTNQSGVVYTYRVRQKTTEGFFTAYSNTGTAAIPFLRPIAPTNFQISELIEGKKFYLSWTYPVSNYDKFELNIRNDSGYIYPPKEIKTLNYTIDGLNQNTVYFFKLRAYWKGLESEYTNEIATPLLKPVNLVGTPPASGAAVQVKLTWTNKAGNASRIEIERRIVGSLTFENISIIGSNISSYSDNGPGLWRGTDYEYRIRAANDDSYSQYSNIIVVKIPY